MDISDILKPEAVKVLSTVSSKKRLFQDIGEIAHAANGIEPSSTVESLLERENLGPTGVGHGVALPHTRMQGLDSVIGVFVALEKPLDFGAIDRKPVDLAFALFAPEEAGVDHLKALALVSRTLRDQDVRGKLRANLDSGKLYAILTGAKAMKAA